MPPLSTQRPQRGHWFCDIDEGTSSRGLIAWVATFIGLRTKSQIRAVMTVALLLGYWLALPVVVRRGWETIHSGRRPLPFLVDSLLTMHPIELIPELERGLRISRIPTPDRPTEEVPPQWLLLTLSLGLHVGAIALVFAQKAGKKLLDLRSDASQRLERSKQRVEERRPHGYTLHGFLTRFNKRA